VQPDLRRQDGKTERIAGLSDANPERLTHGGQRGSSRDLPLWCRPCGL
jgi:hypothetical protein